MFSSWSFSWKCISLLSLTSVVATAAKLGLLLSLGVLLQWHMPWWSPNTPPARSAGIVDGKRKKSLAFLQMGRFCLTRLPYIPIHVTSVTKTWRDSNSNSMAKTWYLGQIHATLVLWTIRMTLISTEEGKFSTAERITVKRTRPRYQCWDLVMRWKNTPELYFKLLRLL